MDKLSKWVVLGRLYSTSQNKYFEVGEVVQLDNKTASILLAKQVVKPHRVEKTKELDDGTNNSTNEQRKR